VRDGRFEGRLLIVWRDARRRVGTFAARDVSGKDSSDKYLYLSREEGWAKSRANSSPLDSMPPYPRYAKTTRRSF